VVETHRLGSVRVMNKNTRVGLLFVVVIIQASSIFGVFVAHQQMVDMIWDLRLDYKALVEETGGPIIDYGLVPNPFAPLYLLALLGLLPLLVLLFDEIRQKNAKN